MNSPREQQQMLVPRFTKEKENLKSLYSSLKTNTFTTSQFSTRYHCTIRDDGWETLAINVPNLYMEHFYEHFYDTAQHDLLAKNCWLYKRVYNARTEWVLKEQVLHYKDIYSCRSDVSSLCLLLKHTRERKLVKSGSK
jgi:hypothetical protein